MNTPSIPSVENEQLTLTRQLARLALVFCALSAPFPLYQGTYDALVANLLMCGLSWWILGRAKRGDVMSGAWLLGACQLAILVQVVGTNPSLGAHHWLLVTAALPFALLPSQLRWVMIVIAALNVASVFIFSLRAEQEHVHAASRIAAETLAALAVAWMAFMARRAADVANSRARRSKALSDSLLDNVLPASVATHLREHPGSFAFTADNTSVLFADLVGFTALTEQIANQHMIDILDELFSAFDEIINALDADKIKTIGDAYMATCNVLNSHDDHALRLVVAGMEMCRRTREVGSRHGHDLGLRVAIHSGPLVGGVLGKERIAFDVWGRTVNTAARLESKAPMDTVMVSDATRLLLPASCELSKLDSWNLKGIDIPVLTWRVDAAPTPAELPSAAKQRTIRERYLDKPLK